MAEGEILLALMKTFGITGALIGFGFFGSRAIWIWVRDHYLPQRLQLLRDQTQAFQRIAELVGRIDGWVSQLDERMAQLHEDVDGVPMDVARIYEIQRTERPSGHRWGQVPKENAA